jgi:hypothetical protein
MAPSKSIISIGIRTTPEVGDKLKAAKAAALEAGYDCEMIVFPVEDFPTELEKFKQQLRSKMWDAVVIGFGLRGNPDHTSLFEQLVNAASDALPGIRFGFSSKPEDFMPCLVRTVGKPE